jgi:diketogulonate reductase-like aldo/keto reductase
MQKVILNNDVKMPVIGFGTYQITDPSLCERCICDAVNIGYRSIDTAAHYNNLEAVGIGIKNCGVPVVFEIMREEAVICQGTKHPCH